MSVFEPRIAYLAHPIDWIDPERMTHWIARATYLLNEAGYAVYDPGSAWNLGANAPDPHLAYRLSLVNERARMHADQVVALIPEQMSSMGVPAELNATIASGTHTPIVWTAEARPSVTLLSWLYSRSIHLVEGLDREEQFSASLWGNQEPHWSSDPEALALLHEQVYGD